MQQYQFRSKLDQTFGPGPVQFLSVLGRLVCAADSPLCVPGGIYLIGGAVRDLIRGCASADLDLMVQSDAPALAGKIRDNWSELAAAAKIDAQILPLKPLIFPKYRTAKLPFRSEVFPGITTIDFSTARSEEYPVPGQPPAIEPGDLASDILRRDFSINALALDLAPQAFGTVIDLTGGVADIENGLIRILHPRSFVDDPARIIRGCRFIARFGYTFDRQTEALAAEALAASALETLPRFRLFDEFKKAADEPLAAKVLEALEAYGALKLIDPLLSLEAETCGLLIEARKAWEKGPLNVADYSSADSAAERFDKKDAIEYWQMAFGILYRQLGSIEYQANLKQRFGVAQPVLARLSLVRHLTFDRILKS